MQVFLQKTFRFLAFARLFLAFLVIPLCQRSFDASFQCRICTIFCPFYMRTACVRCILLDLSVVFFFFCFLYINFCSDSIDVFAIFFLHSFRARFYICLTFLLSPFHSSLVLLYLFLFFASKGNNPHFFLSLYRDQLFFLFIVFVLQ